MEEFIDGSTGDIQEAKKLLGTLLSEPDSATKAIHFGTEEELLIKKIELRAKAGMPPKEKTLKRLAEIRLSTGETE